jgi:hypothetical protein
VSPAEGGGVGGGTGSIGETERQKAVDVLCEAFADDRLGVAEFERRVELAHRAESLQELRTLLSDLPSPTPPVPVGKRDERPLPSPLGRHPTLPATEVREVGVIAGIFGGGTRSGAWRPARVNYAVGVFGGFELDFRTAPLPPGVTEVRVFAMFGGGEIIVPPGVGVEVSAVGIFGGFDETNQEGVAIDPEAPIIRVTGLAIMGGAGVSVRYPGESTRDAKRRRRQERKLEKGK